MTARGSPQRLIKAKKIKGKGKYQFPKWKPVKVIWDDAVADDVWMGEADIDKLKEAEIESYGMFYSCSKSYIVIARSKATDANDDCIEGTLRIPMGMVKSVEEL